MRSGGQLHSSSIIRKWVMEYLTVPLSYKMGGFRQGGGIRRSRATAWESMVTSCKQVNSDQTAAVVIDSYNNA